jgi:hypothetical protein
MGIEEISGRIAWLAKDRASVEKALQQFESKS